MINPTNSYIINFKKAGKVESKGIITSKFAICLRENMKEKLTTRQLQAIQSKEKIRKQAIELFKTTDYEEVLISDICKSIGMSVGSFYNYFSSKEDLIMDLYSSFDEFVEEDLSKRKYDSNIDAIKDALYQLAKSAESHGIRLSSQMLRIQLKCEQKYLNNNTRYFDYYVNQRVKNAIEEKEIVTTYSAEEISSLLLRITRGTLYDWAMKNDPEYVSMPNKVLHDIDMILNSKLNALH